MSSSNVRLNFTAVSKPPKSAMSRGSARRSISRIVTSSIVQLPEPWRLALLSKIARAVIDSRHVAATRCSTAAPASVVTVRNGYRFRRCPSRPVRMLGKRSRPTDSMTSSAAVRTPS